MAVVRDLIATRRACPFSRQCAVQPWLNSSPLPALFHPPEAENFYRCDM